MFKFQYPLGAEAFDAAAFRQDGTFIKAGHREECEVAAQEERGLYVWWYKGQPVIRRDFEYGGADTEGQAF